VINFKYCFFIFDHFYLFNIAIARNSANLLILIVFTIFVALPICII